MPAPDLQPSERPSTGLAAADSYRPDDPVWVHRAGRWRPGRVERSSSLAVTVRYRPTDQRGTGVDTVTAAYLAPGRAR
jgi:hypothetical protein